MNKIIKKILVKAGEIGTEDLQSKMLSELYDIKATGLLPDLNAGYVPWSSFAIRPSALVMILNELVMNNSKTVIECGIGISTLHILSSEMGDDIKVIGIDDDADWIALVTGHLERMGVSSDRYCLIHAPIKRYDDVVVGPVWYDIDAIDAEITKFLVDEKADMLLVDGPKGNLCDKSRYQALPKLNKYLNDDYAVFLDDIVREEEYVIGQLWSNEFNLKIAYYPEKGGLAILRPHHTKKDRIIA